MRSEWRTRSCSMRLKTKGVTAEMLIFEYSGHGFGLSEAI